MPTSDPLSAETLARMKAEHKETADGDCLTCKTEPFWGEVQTVRFPCDAALLLAERITWAPVDTTPLEQWQRIAYGLLGPSTMEDLAR